MGTLENAILLVAADVDSGDIEEKFNRWYDVEHLIDKLRVEGMVSGARYVAIEGGPRYLCLYRAESVAVFDSESYRRGLRTKSRWTVATVDTLRNPMRRVCASKEVAGRGSGSWLAMFTLAQPLADAGDPALQKMADSMNPVIARAPGMVRGYWLIPNARLSDPLPTEAAEGRQMNSFLIVESNSEAASVAAVQTCAEAWPVTPLGVSRYRLLWKMFSSEL